MPAVYLIPYSYSFVQLAFFLVLQRKLDFKGDRLFNIFG